ncbi:MAG: glycosyl hydrolase family 28-related protein [Verrucomicrobiales bacterium]
MVGFHLRLIHLYLLLTLTLPVAVAADVSELWGKDGENWDPAGRLPGVSFAGYACGEELIPSPPVAVDVRAFGAKGDGTTDDSAAFLEAIAKTQQGVIFVPPGRYKITRILEITRSGVVLRGAGTAKTALYCPVPLHHIKPDMGETTEGRPTSNYSWSGGMVWFKGNDNGKRVGRVAAPAKRGDSVLRLDRAPEKLQPGEWVELRQTDDEKKSLLHHVYSEDPGDISRIPASRHRNSFVARVKSTEGSSVTLDRPLRIDVRPEWQPVLSTWEPDVQQSGVESMRFEFPARAYDGHFTELGFNAVALQGVAHCWARDLELVNADSGIFVSGRFCTIEGIVCRLVGATEMSNDFGHHGISMTGSDNLLSRFDLQQRFIHDITVAGGSGNVARAGRGWDLAIDHHRRAPHDNVFTNLDAGEGSRLWRSGGGRALGRHCGARGTFWNIRSKREIPSPKDFGPDDLNLVGFVTGSNSGVHPPDLYRAQLEKRLRK